MALLNNCYDLFFNRITFFIVAILSLFLGNILSQKKNIKYKLKYIDNFFSKATKLDFEKKDLFNDLLNEKIETGLYIENKLIKEYIYLEKKSSVFKKKIEEYSFDKRQLNKYNGYIYYKVKKHNLSVISRFKLNSIFDDLKIR